MSQNGSRCGGEKYSVAVLIKMLLPWIVAVVVLSVMAIVGFCQWGACVRRTSLVQQQLHRIKRAAGNDLPRCYKGGAETERGERDVARRHTDPDATVLEFGGGAGSVAVTVQQRLRNPRCHAVIQPREDPGAMFGGVDALAENKQACGAQFTVVDHVLQEGECIELDEACGPFDTVVADCEGCLVSEYAKNPSLFANVRQIQVERDDGGAYDALLRDALGMRVVATGYGCDGRCDTEVWERCAWSPPATGARGAATPRSGSDERAVGATSPPRRPAVGRAWRAAFSSGRSEAPATPARPGRPRR
jgi:hypothetical protein